jgi:hypothetical protein
MQIRMHRHATGSRLPSDAILRCGTQRLSGRKVSSSECDSRWWCWGWRSVWYSLVNEHVSVGYAVSIFWVYPKTAGTSDKLHGVTFQNIVILTSQLLRSLWASPGMWQHKDDLGRRNGKWRQGRRPELYVEVYRPALLKRTVRTALPSALLTYLLHAAQSFLRS